MNGSTKKLCPSRNRSPCWHSLRVSKASTEHTDISSWARLMFADFMLNSGRREKVSFLGVASDPTRPPYPQLLSLRGPSSAALQSRIVPDSRVGALPVHGRDKVCRWSARRRGLPLGASPLGAGSSRSSSPAPRENVTGGVCRHSVLATRR